MLDKSWTVEATALGYENEKEMLTDLYITHAFSISQIANMLGYAPFSVRRRLLMVLKTPLRARGGPNRKGKRTLAAVPLEKLMETSPKALAAEYECHIGTIFAEKRLRQTAKGGTTT